LKIDANRQLLTTLAMPSKNKFLKNQTNATPSAFDAAGISQAYIVLETNRRDAVSF
jgi:hypothetical protein